MRVSRGVSRRDFLRLRPTERGRLIEISCHRLFMRCADGALVPDAPLEYEPWMGEPPSMIRREPAAAILGRIEHELEGARIVRLLEPEWLSSMIGGARLQAALAAFRERGGVLEYGPPQ